VRFDRRAIEREVARHAGVSIRFEHSGHHFRAVLAYAGRTRFVIMSESSSDHRATRNQISDVRREIRRLKSA
jgi:hypothetical protein